MKEGKGKKEENERQKQRERKVEEREKNKKFELMLTRCAKAYSSSGLAVKLKNWGVHAKLINKYQILYLDRIGLMIVLCRHLVNDIDLCRSPKSAKKSIKPPILAFKVIQNH